MGHSAGGSWRWDWALLRDRSDRSPRPRAVAAERSGRKCNGRRADPCDDRLGSGSAYHHGPDGHSRGDPARDGAVLASDREGALDDRRDQFAIAVFAATFTFCLFSLRAIDTGPGAPVPGVTICTAFVLTIASAAALFLFVNHAGHRLRVA